MMGVLKSERSFFQRLRSTKSIGITGVVATWLLLVGCEQEQPAASAPPVKTANSDLFAAPGSQPSTQAKPPVNNGPPPEGVSARNVPGAGGLDLLPSLDPAAAKVCKELKEQELGLRKEADNIRESKVAPVAAAAEKAMDKFISCQEDFSCAGNDATYKRLAIAAKKTEADLEARETDLMVVEGQLHDVSQKISVQCGDF